MSDDIKATFNDKLPTEYELRLKALKEMDDAWKAQAAERLAVYEWVLRTLCQEAKWPPGAAKFVKGLKAAIEAMKQTEAAGVFNHEVGGHTDAERTAADGSTTGAVADERDAGADAGSEQRDASPAGSGGSEGEGGGPP